MTSTKFVEVTSANPAKLYGLYPRKGSLIPGVSDADVVVWYPEGKHAEITITNGMLHHATDYTPYEARKISNWPRYTILRGKIVWDRDGGGILGNKEDGQFIKRGPTLWTGCGRQLRKMASLTLPDYDVVPKSSKR